MRTGIGLVISIFALGCVNAQLMNWFNWHGVNGEQQPMDRPILLDRPIPVNNFEDDPKHPPIQENGNNWSAPQNSLNVQIITTDDHIGEPPVLMGVEHRPIEVPPSPPVVVPPPPTVASPPSAVVPPPSAVLPPLEPQPEPQRPPHTRPLSHQPHHHHQPKPQEKPDPRPIDIEINLSPVINAPASPNSQSPPQKESKPQEKPDTQPIQIEVNVNRPGHPSESFDAGIHKVENGIAEPTPKYPTRPRQ